MENIKKSNLYTYILFSLEINNNILFYLCNPFSARRTIFIKCYNKKPFITKDIYWEDKKIIKNDSFNTFLELLNNKITNNYKTIKKIYYIDDELKKENNYQYFLNNKSCLFLHISKDTFNNYDFLDTYIKINKYIEKYLKETNISISDINLYKIQYYLNMRFIKIFNN